MCTLPHSYVSAEGREWLSRTLRRGDVRVISVTVDTLGPAALDALDQTIGDSDFREAQGARIRLVQDFIAAEVAAAAGSSKAEPVA